MNKQVFFCFVTSTGAKGFVPVRAGSNDDSRLDSIAMRMCVAPPLVSLCIE